LYTGLIDVTLCSRARADKLRHYNPDASAPKHPGKLGQLLCC